MTKRTGWTASITDEERARIRKLLDLENRSGSQQLMHMVDKRLAEIEREKNA